MSHTCINTLYSRPHRGTCRRSVTKYAHRVHNVWTGTDATICFAVLLLWRGFNNTLSLSTNKWEDKLFLYATLVASRNALLNCCLQELKMIKHWLTVHQSLDSHIGGATCSRVHLGEDYFIVLYSGNDFKCFHRFWGVPTVVTHTPTSTGWWPFRVIHIYRWRLKKKTIHILKLTVYQLQTYLWACTCIRVHIQSYVWYALITYARTHTRI